MVSPGGGAGMKSRAHAAIKSIMHNILVEMKNFEPGSVEFNALAGALTKMNGVFGKSSSSDETMPAAQAQNHALQRPGGAGPAPNAAPPGIAGPPPSIAPGGGARPPSGIPPGGPGMM